MRVEVVASGIKGGTFNSGCAAATVSVAATGSGAGAAGAAAGFLVFLVFFFFLPPDMPAPAPATQQQHNANRRIHCQICSWEPQEPEAVEPELAEPELSLALDPVLKESPELEEPSGPKPSTFKDLEEGPEADEDEPPDDAEESMAVNVVVTVSFAAYAKAGRRARARATRAMVTTVRQ